MHFIQLWDISSHLSSAVLHSALSKQSQSPCFFLLSFQSNCVFLLWQKHKILQPGNFHMSQVKASAVQQKGWLCSSSHKHEVSPCQPGCLQGGWKQHFVFAYSQVQICSGGYCNTQKALPAPHSELRPALMLSPGWMLIWIVISCVRRTLLMCEMASGSLAGKMSDFSRATGLFSSPLYIILPRNLRCLVLTCNWN